jgi:hypothetical protein
MQAGIEHRLLLRRLVLHNVCNLGVGVFMGAGDSTTQTNDRGDKGATKVADAERCLLFHGQYKTRLCN